MATNVFRHWSKSEHWEVASTVRAGDVVINNVDSRIGVALTSPGAATESVTGPDGLTVSNYPVGGVGNKVNSAEVALDGDFLLTVVGATAGETVGTGQTGTPQGTKVYGVVSGGAFTGYTLTAGTNTAIGVVADGRIVGTVTPVSIGVGV